MGTSGDRYYEFGPFRLDTAEYSLSRGGEQIPLTPKVFETLLVLVKNSGRVVDKEELLRVVWGDAFVEETNLTKNISILRKVLTTGDPDKSYIETVPKRGYRFVAPVQIADPPSEGSGTRPEKQALLANKAAKALLIALTLSVLLLAGYFGYQYLQPTTEQIDSIAVLPFVNESGNPEIEYLSDGLTESVIKNLSQLADIRVKPRSTVFRYKGKEIDSRSIGRELGVQAILRGHVVQRGQGLAFFVELIDVASDKVIWSEQYNRSQLDLPTVENEISRDVSSKLHVRLSGTDQQKILKMRTSNSEAYRMYLRGRHEWNKFSLDGLTRSITFFEKAIEIDPNYALAYSGLADSYVSLGIDHLPPQEYMPKAKTAALRAIELDGTLAEAYSSLGSYRLFFEWDTASAEREYLKAISLDPNYSNARHFYSHCLQFSGREAEALREMKTAVEIEPLSSLNNAELAWAYYLARQYDASIEQALRTLELDSQFAYAHFVLGSTYTAKGNYAQALAALEKGEKLEPGWLELKGQLAFTHAAAGNRARAQSILANVLDSAEGGYINEVVVASVYAALGDNDHALDWLERGYNARCSWTAWIHIEPNLDRLRSDERFQKLIRKVGSL